MKEYLGKEVEVVMDRPLGSKHPKFGFVYEVNYGYISNTKAPDGDEIDAYVLGVDKPLEKFKGRVIAIVHRLDDDDDKLVVVSGNMDFTDKEILKLTNFQEKFFKPTVIR